MSSVRYALVSLGIAALVGGSLFDIATGREHWPFSPYPMYSDVSLDPSTTKVLLVALPADPTTASFPLVEVEHIQPFDKSRLGTALSRLNGRTESERWLEEAARDVLARYEMLRQRGRHNGPPLRAVRIYERRWQLDPWARNVDRPDTERLLVHVDAHP